jgi:hypothetical protein
LRKQRVLLLGELLIPSLGAGSFEDPYLIYSWSDLNKVRNHLSGYYKLMKDLSSSDEGYDLYAGPNSNGGKGWLPLGKDYSSPFSGSFDGNNKKISDIHISRDSDYVGVFGFSSGKIYNLFVSSSEIKGGEKYVGGIAGYNHGKIINSHFEGSVFGVTRTGGITGYSGRDSLIVNSSFSGRVTGGDYIGGIAGLFYGDSGRGSFIENCFSEGSIYGNWSVGGLVGRDYDLTSKIIGSFWDMDSSEVSTSKGGIGKSSLEMKSYSTYVNAEWSISKDSASSIWFIESSYPRLWWESLDDFEPFRESPPEKISCENEGSCSFSGEKYCQGNLLFSCSDLDYDGCLEVTKVYCDYQCYNEECIEEEGFEDENKTINNSENEENNESSKGCVDTDYGKNYIQKGSVIFFETEDHDYCLSSSGKKYSCRIFL